MDAEQSIKRLEQEWDYDAGFFGLLRRAEFDPTGFGRLLQAIKSIDLRDDTTVSRRLVALLWYMPLFMGWQKERLREAGGDVAELERATNTVEGLLETILGVP